MRTRRLGMTLIEIMLVVVIMAMIASAVAYAVLPMGDDANKKLARQGVLSLTNVAEMYTMQHPAEGCPALEDLRPLLGRGSSLEDPWGTRYALLCEDTPVARSAGPDREHGTADDIALE